MFATSNQSNPVQRVLLALFIVTSCCQTAFQPMAATADTAVESGLAAEDVYEQTLRGTVLAANVNPNVASYKLNAGYALNRIGNYDTAVKWLDSGLKIDPENANGIQARQFAIESVSGESRSTAGTNARSRAQSGTQTQAVRTQRVSRESINSLAGTWSMNITANSNFLHAYITLGNGGQYGGVMQKLNQDRTVTESLIDGTWKIVGNQLTIIQSDGVTSTYTVQLDGKTLSVLQQGKKLFSYRKVG